jgi:hypothetical protein
VHQECTKTSASRPQDTRNLQGGIPRNQNFAGIGAGRRKQQVAMKPDESLSPSLFTFHSHFAAIHHH